MVVTFDVARRGSGDKTRHTAATQQPHKHCGLNVKTRHTATTQQPLKHCGQKVTSGVKMKSTLTRTGHNVEKKNVKVDNRLQSGRFAVLMDMALNNHSPHVD